MTSKLPRPKLPTVPGVSRRQQYSASTRRALVVAAEDLFTVGGYASTSLDAIVSAARVTKGALYHHYSGKQALFEAVFQDVEVRATERIRAAIRGASDPWERAIEALRAFLDVVQEPSYRRVVVQEGPAILGYERFREQEERSTYGVVTELVRDVLDAGPFDLDEEMVETFSRILFGAMSAAGESVSDSDDPRSASERVEAAIGLVLAGLRSLGTETATPGTDPGAADTGAAGRDGVTGS